MIIIKRQNKINLQTDHNCKHNTKESIKLYFVPKQALFTPATSPQRGDESLRYYDIHCSASSKVIIIEKAGESV